MKQIGQRLLLDMANSALGGGCDSNCGACSQAASCSSKARAGQFTGPQQGGQENQNVAVSAVGAQNEQRLFAAGSDAQALDLNNRVTLNQGLYQDLTSMALGGYQ